MAQRQTRRHHRPLAHLRFIEFLPDTQTIGHGVIVGLTGWEMVLENNKQAFASEFAQRTRFTSALPTLLTPAQLVNQLFMNTGVTPSATDRQTAINEFGSATNTSDVSARGRALRDVAENSILTQQEFNRAFVLMQYFGYLRRNPNDAPDSDYSDYDFWLTKLNFFNGNYESAEMVKAFITLNEIAAALGTSRTCLNEQRWKVKSATCCCESKAQPPATAGGSDWSDASRWPSYSLC